MGADELTNRELLEKSRLVALAGPAAAMRYSGELYHAGFVAERAADWELVAKPPEIRKFAAHFPRKPS